MNRRWLTLTLLVFCTTGASAQTVEVLHGWTSGSERAALAVLKDAAERRGLKWWATAIPGDSEALGAALRERIAAGRPPAVVPLLGFDILEQAAQDGLADVEDLAARQGWDHLVPTALRQFSKSDGKWVAVPLGVHSTNWVWANKAVLDKAGVSKMPVTWDEFIAALEQVSRSGVVALAHGGQPWQDAILFDGVVMSTGGIDFYRRSIVRQERDALVSDTMLKVFERMAVLHRYVDKDASGRDWAHASAMVIAGQAGFQLTGDWARGEFTLAKRVAGRDFLCSRFPGTQGMVAFGAEQLVWLRSAGASGQKPLAGVLMTPAFQSAFNAVKGSVPARTDVPNTAFDDCGKKGMADLAEAVSKNTLVGSMAKGHAVRSATKLVIQDIITRQFNGRIDAKAAVGELAKVAVRQ